MKTEAVYILEPGKVEVREIDLPDPGYGCVQVEVKANGICAGDVARFRGEVSIPSPHVFGHEAAGVISKVGPGVEGLREGDKVGCIGGFFSKFTNISADLVAKIPEDVVDYEFWLLEPVACVVNSFSYFELAPADRVVLIGAGFMGLLITQGLSHTLASEVIVIDIDAKKLDMARSFGATEVIDSSTPEGVERIEELKGRKADLVIEAAGTGPALDLATELPRTGGRIAIFSWHHGRDPVDLSRWHLGGFKVLNTSPMIDFGRDYSMNVLRTEILMEKGVFDLKPLITHTMSYRKCQEIFEVASERKDGYIKGVILF